MNNGNIELIENAFENIENINSSSPSDIIKAIDSTIEDIDTGNLRVAEKINNNWVINQWVKKAILLYFRINDMKLISGSSGDSHWWDKIDSKFQGWDEEKFVKSGFRAVPGSIVRKGSFVAKGSVLMPSFINIGAYVGSGTMVDTWATIGSCAQIGSNCHISGGAGIGGVLEPLQANPVIIEDNCFIGARAEVAEGVIVKEGSVLSMGVFLSASTPIVDRETGKIIRGEVPPYSVIIPGTFSPNSDNSKPSLYCAVIVKTVDEKTRSKTSINELLRD
ncbi:2,3,4,5-tetrahydropyridine-2,6-dicarboxylate N-succinyltransferase [Hyphomicrobiales bacterium]|jgi:2,3,4,5-tetrahydropyridine-2-carboxylate N-succinyltransferase|nr:2,3,4,5-tetrahydropyridine-2,6-dicarboxylate N-succinyltransferase [Hyphomicrobiales bacterium]MDA8893067.1 2,3,4,5-tetrahydropyridine-2,6-dicarboxylate N-succinyltransferase [Hyphomicrobiales bacterium]MDA9034198.1 2,3,4,5-tetrahydropyridine-2,6-dicarboxylate N-succinyltransferase [Hyphomicrobiales bacterium]MDA9904309.1 2,3,4,5-tetrahydropyridine-2,6-dicarboxylate N-succinyltransferase [Hyphomicrobiales bacterium]MDB4247224.1 2,3,4,5-tetrahydropyridine-2,6-dicarboxylate N-succinyltransfera|tara:strand:+ start:3605 stop:4435 length:831 start_codon:yes stop_codon:yes gene_type:complete